MKKGSTKKGYGGGKKGGDKRGCFEAGDFVAPAGRKSVGQERGSGAGFDGGSNNPRLGY